MARTRTRAEAEAVARAYAATVRTTPVLPEDLRPGMVRVDTDGARYRIATVMEDVRGIAAGRIGIWRERGIDVSRVTYHTVNRIDDFGLPGADAERELEARTGPTLCIVSTVAASRALRVEVDSLSVEV